MKRILACFLILIGLSVSACAPASGLTGIVQRAESDGTTVILYFSNNSNSDFVTLDAMLLVEDGQVLQAVRAGQTVSYMLGLGKDYVGRKIHVEGAIVRNASGARQIQIRNRNQLTIVN